MAFTLSGTTITQSGTDTDLSGLSGIAGVTTYDDFYVLDGLRLEITGDLSFNTRTERIVINGYSGVAAGASGYRGAITIRSGATWTNTARRDDGRVLDLPVIQVSEFDAEFNEHLTGGAGARCALEVAYGGTANFEGVFTTAIQDTGAGVVYAFYGTTNAIDCKFYNTVASRNNHQLAFAPSTDLVNFQNVETSGMNIVDRGALSITNFSNVSTFYAYEGYNLGGGATSGTANRYFLVPNFTTDGHSGQDIRINANGGERITGEFRDSNKGNGLALNISDTVAQNCRYIVSATLNIEFLDDSLSLIDATYYAIDVDNGLRQSDFTPEGQPLIACSSDIEYTGVAVSGLATEVIYTGFKGPANGTALDNRGVNSDGDMLFGAIAYNNNIAAFQPSLLGLGEKSTTAILPTDSLITESDKAITDAYTELETAQKFYDYAKSYLVDNYAGETATIVTRSGDTIDAGSYDLVIDATAASVFEFDGTTITIKASSFTGLITTTGTVTLLNGATANFFDANQDSSLSEINSSYVKIYGTETDRDSRTNSIYEGNQYNFLFSTVPANPVYLWVTQGNTELPSSITLTQGENVVDLSTAGVLTSLGDTINDIDSQLGYIARVVYCDIRSATNGDGSNSNPFNNIDSAITEFNTGGYSHIDLKTAIDVPAVPSLSLESLRVIGSNPTAHLVISNLDCSSAEFDHLLIQGVQGNSVIQATFNHCKVVGDFTNLFANFENNCQILSLTGTSVNIGFIGASAIIDCKITNVGDTTISVSNNASLAIRNITGKFTLSGIQGSSVVSIDSFSGDLTLDSSCSGGSVRIYDTIKINDNSTGTVKFIEDLPTLTQMIDGGISTFDSTADQVIVSTNNDKTGYSLNNNSITSSTIANNAFNNSAFTTGYYNSINAEVDSALSDYDAPTKAELDIAEANIVTEINANETKIDTIQASVDNISFDDTAILSAISALNDISATDVRAELSTELARLDVNVSSVVYDDTVLTALISALPTLAQMEASAALTAIADITGLSTHDAASVVTAMQVVADDFKADLTGVALTTDVTGSETSIVAEINANETLINSIITSLGSLNDPTKEEIRDALLLVKDDFKADLTSLSVPQVSDIVSGLQAVSDDFKDMDTDDLKNHITAMNFAS